MRLRRLVIALLGTALLAGPAGADQECDEFLSFSHAEQVDTFHSSLATIADPRMRACAVGYAKWLAEAYAKACRGEIAAGEVTSDEARLPLMIRVRDTCQAEIDAANE
jgi:hypothetical protein